MNGEGRVPAKVIGSLIVSLWGTGAMDPVAALSVIDVLLVAAGLSDVHEKLGENRLEASLDTALYLGDRWDCLARAAGLRLRLWTVTAPEKGHCWVSVPSSSLWIF